MAMSQSDCKCLEAAAARAKLDELSDSVLAAGRAGETTTVEGRGAKAEADFNLGDKEETEEEEGDEERGCAAAGLKGVGADEEEEEKEFGICTECEGSHARVATICSSFMMCCCCAMIWCCCCN